MATPKIAELKFSFLVLAIINASPPKNAIKTSLISGLVLASSSDDFLDVLNNKKMDYSALKDVKLIINQGSTNSNTFIKELRLRDSIDLANKSDEVNKLLSLIHI